MRSDLWWWLYLMQGLGQISNKGSTRFNRLVAILQVLLSFGAQGAGFALVRKQPRALKTHFEGCESQH